MILKYKEMGYQCLPIRPRTKFPALPAGYSTLDYSLHGITEDQASEWDELYPIKNGYGVGLFCGKASNVTIIDIDTDDIEVIKLLPFTPCVRKGKTGQGRVYAYNENIPNKLRIGNDNGTKDFVEVLNDGAYSLLPPSIHPETNQPYMWIGEEALEHVDSNKLPRISIADLNKIRDYYAKKYNKELRDINERKETVDIDGIYSASEGRCAHGSHDRILKKAALLIAASTPFEKAVKELIEYDKEHHVGISYFEDKSRGKDSAADPNSNAARFITSLLHTVNTQRKRQGLPLHEMFNTSVVEEIKIQEPAKETEKKKMPAISGMMKKFVDYLNHSGVSYNSEVYLGASLAWLSMLVSSRYCVKTKAFTTPANLMLWGILPSGVGKDSPQSLLQRLLFDHKVLGSGSYKSAPALVMNLCNVIKEKKGETELVRKAQRENLMIIDECSTLFRMVQNGENYQKDIIETLNTLYSRSSGFFAGDQSIARGAGYGAAYNPYFTLIGFTTYNNFNSIIGENIVGNGFFERSLVFVKTKKSKFNDEPYKDEKLFQELKEFTDFCLDKPIRLVTHGVEIPAEQEIKTEVAYEAFPINGETETAMHEYRKKMYSIEGAEIDEAFYNRFGEIVAKVSLLHAISEKRAYIGLEDFNWAVQLVEWSYSYSRPAFEKMKTNDPYRDAADKIIAVINKMPSKMAARTYVTRHIWFKHPGKKAAFLDELIELGYLKKENINSLQMIKPGGDE